MFFLQKKLAVFLRIVRTLFNPLEICMIPQVLLGIISLTVFIYFTVTSKHIFFFARHIYDVRVAASLFNPSFVSDAGCVRPTHTYVFFVFLASVVSDIIIVFLGLNCVLCADGTWVFHPKSFTVVLIYLGINQRLLLSVCVGVSFVSSPPPVSLAS